MSTLPSMRPDRPRLLSSDTPEQAQLTSWRDELLWRIDFLAGWAVDLMADSSAAAHAGGLHEENRERLRERLIELMRDEMHFALEAIENDLERT